MSMSESDVFASKESGYEVTTESASDERVGVNDRLYSSMLSMRASVEPEIMKYRYMFRGGGACLVTVDQFVHVNIGIIFSCTEISQSCLILTQSKSDWLFNTQSRVLQADWLILYETIMRRQLRASTCPIAVTKEFVKGYMLQGS